MSYDLAVIGGGPAGLSAAINARARNKSVLVVTNDYRESPLYRAEKIDNHLGMPDLNGKEMLEAFQRHAEDMGVTFRGGRVLNIAPMEGVCYLSIGSDVEDAKAVVVATGVARGKKFQGEAELLGRGVSYCATCDGMLYRGKDVAVVGLAPDAPAEANFLHGLGCRVSYIAAKAPPTLAEGITFHKTARLEVLGESAVTALKCGDTVIPCAAVFILRHAVAPTDLLPGVALDNGYIAVDRAMQTNLPGIFAAGDCTGTPLQLSKAVGEGQVAGQKAAEYIDALSVKI